ncbi:hypothetical protein BEWA_034490 [Theileria equi strain WA]|uniref:Uncharacterized protein n=1 Tax=Theileria equi strain WA TaxID=1537102 RepID=L0B010_THEEQ|nr:hypothetical protein BEWA_034490 [Theileria equi strain WA]AFZ80591.1 hypothetical protein BEWA_034490 [Theileria equi strain WA]|eukprot:XP_004830257.1 hypothetical protein BEWA_034490 [Theileria equi strain WA]
MTDSTADSNAANTQTTRGPPIIDNFTLLYYDKTQELIKKPYNDSKNLSDEEIFRNHLFETLEAIAQLKNEVANKNQAKFLIEEKLKIQLRDSRNQTKHFGVFGSNQSALLQAIDSNYKRLKLLYEKIYAIQMDIQHIYMRLYEDLEKRCEHLVEIHKNSRLCAASLYHHKKRNT